LATDHNPRTAWFTETYGGSPAFGGTKSGVGLLVSVPINAKVTRLDIQGATPGARVEIRTPSQMTGRPLVGGVTLTGRVQQILVPPTSDQDLVVWITRLVPDPHAVGAFYAGIAQVNVWGVPNTSP
jgi:putative peptidoglycan lipid II flippase